MGNKKDMTPQEMVCFLNELAVHSEGDTKDKLLQVSIFLQVFDSLMNKWSDGG